MAATLSSLPSPASAPAGDARAGGVRPYARRFGWLALALGILAGGALAAFVFLVVRGDGGAPPAAHTVWSEWAPHGSGDEALTQIGERVSWRYRLKDGSQMVTVRSGLPAVTGRPVVVAESTAGDPTLGNHTFVSSHAALYVMCGLGASCAVTGTPSVDRMLVLRREALELALYVFTYVPSRDTVVTFLPPAAGQDPKYAVVLHRSDVAPQLAQPLALTLPGPPPTPEELTKRDTAQIESLTGRGMTTFSFSQLVDGSVALFLDHLQ